MNNKEYPRVLIISDATWADDNNIGNTFSNLFQDWPKESLAMIYARSDMPNTSVCDNFFQVSENRLVKRFFNSSIQTGIRINSSQLTSFEEEQILSKEEITGKKIYRFFLKHRWNIFLLAREFLWKIGIWRTKELDEYIKTFNPDIVLSLACSGIYMNRIQQHALRISNAKSIVYFVDDVYSMKKVSLSPLFWISLMMQRRSINKTVELSNLVYAIVPKQKDEYDKSFNIETHLLTKGGIFNEFPPKKIEIKKTIRLVYTGNIYVGRWESLEEIGRALDKINENYLNGILYIYTTNKLTKKMSKSLLKIKSIKFMGRISADQVSEVQSKADILVHVESLTLREKLITRLSFSTKLVDYFAHSKCILAVGWDEAASIEYLRKNDLAIIIEDLKKIDQTLQKLFDEQDLIERYGLKSWEFGEKNHDIYKIKQSFRKDMINLIKDENSFKAEV